MSAGRGNQIEMDVTTFCPLGTSEELVKGLLSVGKIEIGRKPFTSVNFFVFGRGVAFAILKAFGKTFNSMHWL